MATPWPNKPCPHCGRQITDLLAEMVDPSRKGSPEQKALIGLRPGGAITCPYCQGAIEYSAAGELVQSTRTPLRYSRSLIEQRTQDYGDHFHGNPHLTPEEWIELDKAMPGALKAYRYAEDKP
ncbi:MAG TPA: hypothetical protein VEL76_39895 [Gemmataceae bacterium]|nr:hypothetical protein [Gemmataceae bacterium]